jgi:tetratricopeptide (TPR) repeat protein
MTASEVAPARVFVFTCFVAVACGGSPAHLTSVRPEVAAESTDSPSASASTTDELTFEQIAEGAQHLEGLGALHRTVTTSSPEAQAFFDQGLRLSYGFNHDEAARSFARAAMLDPSCAMCFWGAAYTLGPNYNVPMLADRARAAWDALERARETVDGGTEVERALVAALAHRYAGPTYVDPPSMQPFVEAYAAEMREVAARFPDDVDVQVLFAEAAMNVNAWHLWTLDGAPEPGTTEIVDVLERVLAADDQHPGANHFYIHVIEASSDPARALPSAERLPSLMPGAGHIVHMPAHIFQRVGRYADASEANRRAIVADRRYLETIQPLGYYPMYLGHNYGFLAYSASMEGRRSEAIEASRLSAAALPMDFVCGMPGMDFFLSEPLFVMVRFGMWEELLAEPQPDPRHAVLAALHRQAHGMALAARDRPDEAREDLATLRRLASEIPDDALAGLSSGRAVLELASKVLEASIAERSHDERAIDLWEEAVSLEDRLAYNEPADWFYPTRHFLGAALLDRGRSAEAESVYRADLARHPANGWALFGLGRALEAQQRVHDALVVEAERETAWANADVVLSRSAY